MDILDNVAALDSDFFPCIVFFLCSLVAWTNSAEFVSLQCAAAATSACFFLLLILIFKPSFREVVLMRQQLVRDCAQMFWAAKTSILLLMELCIHQGNTFKVQAAIQG